MKNLQNTKTRSNPKPEVQEMEKSELQEREMQKCELWEQENN